MKPYKLIAFISAVMGLLFLLTACGASAAKSKGESAICADIVNEDHYFSNYSLNIDSSHITKRQTNEDDKNDFVWIEVNASNDVFTYSANYELTYVLYNDGWLLDNYKKTNSSVAPKVFPTLEDAMGILDSQMYGDYEPMSEGHGPNFVSYSFQRSAAYHCLITNYITTISYNFSPDSLWTYSISDDKYGYSLDIEGEWEYQDSERSFYINVISVGKEINQHGTIDITLSYELENIHVSSRETTTKSSNGPINMEINAYDSSRNRWSITLDPYSVYGNISMYLGVDSYRLTESTGYGIACDGYFLTRK